MRASDHALSAVPDGSIRAQFERLYDEARDAVYGFTLARCADSSLAEEVTADAFIAAWTQMFSTNQPVNTGWVITVARRRLIDQWRRRSTLDDRVRRLAASARSTHSDSPLERNDDAIIDALQSLPDRQRAAVTLRYLDEFSVSEIAEVLDTSYKSVESLLSRGKASLRAAYEEVRHDY